MIVESFAGGSEKVKETRRYDPSLASMLSYTCIYDCQAVSNWHRTLTRDRESSLTMRLQQAIASPFLDRSSERK